jgi:DNA repair protein SbcC/Rad50
MIPKRVLLENFLSFGEPAAEIIFTDNEPLWVICGPNGVGKSAIFDAVTYALFAYHRGGSRNAEQLIRHGAAGFRVEFDFEINGKDYRIIRTKSGRTTQRVLSRVPGTNQWEPEHIGNAAPDVKKWVEKNIGLEFEAFKASVLLRQGEADAILTATGSERLALLKTIIGVDRFEQISEHIHDAFKDRKCELEKLKENTQGVAAPTEEQINAAAEALARAELHRQQIQERSAKAGELLAAARQWNSLAAKKANLERAIREAAERAEQSSRIQSDKARLDELTAVAPKLKSIIALRDKIDTREKDLAELKSREAESQQRRLACGKAAEEAGKQLESFRFKADEHDREAKRLRDEHARESKSLAAAEDLTRLETELGAYPVDLAEQLEAAEKAAKTAASAAQKAGETKATTAEFLKQVEEQQRKFAKVGVDVKCSLCGQIVDKKHAKLEKERLAADVTDLQKKLKANEKAAKEAAAAWSSAEAKLNELFDLDQKRKQTADQLAAKRETLAGLGIAAGADEMRRQLRDKDRAATEHEQLAKTVREKQQTTAAEKTKLEEQGRQLEKQVAELADKTRTTETANAADVSQRNTLNDQLAAEWQARWATLDTAGFSALETERKGLEGSGIAEAFEKLQFDAARREEWVKQLAEATTEMDSIPTESRLSIDDVERRNQSAAAEQVAAETARDEAKSKVDELNRQAESQRKLAEELRGAERRFDLHEKLDELLGKKGLQRELVRSAELEIVSYAKDTLDKLSDGDLTLELAVEDDADTAFDLRVRQANDPAPIAVAFLSGSQKFRVAVSIALAIGRFASGQARPLESVIIDEGFGSLDRDGLRAMADELNRLRGFLRRIVLVSHQEDFTGRFPVGYRLVATEKGAVAEPFRR